MDMPDGSVWRNPKRPPAVVAGAVPKLDEEDKVCCWNCGEREPDVVVDAVDENGYCIRAGVCWSCFRSEAIAEGWNLEEVL